MLLFLLEGFEPAILHGNAVLELLLQDAGIANDIAFLNFFPIVEGVRGMVQMFVDRADWEGTRFE